MNEELLAFFERCEQASPDRRAALETEATARLVAEANSQPLSQSILFTSLGLLQRLQPDLPRSEKSLLEAERMADNSGNAAWLARVRLYLTAHFSLCGDFDRALELASLSRADLDSNLLPRLLSNLAVLHQMRHDGPAALATFADGLDAAEKENDGNVIVTILNNRGCWLNDTGAFAEAEVDFRQALLYQGPQIEPFRLASIQHNLGLALTRQGMVRAGLHEMDQARGLLEDHGDNAIQTRLDRTEALFRARLLAESDADIGEVLEQIQEAGMQSRVPEALLLSSQIATARADRVRAAELAEAASSALERQDRDAGQDRLADSLAAVLDLSQPLPADLDTSTSSVVEALLLRGSDATDQAMAAEAWELVEQRPATLSIDRALGAFAGARLHRQAGDHGAAAERVDRCFAAVAETAAEFSSLEIRQAILTSLVPIQFEAISLAVEMDDRALFTRWLSSGADASRRRQPSSKDSAELIDRLEDLRRLNAEREQPVGSAVEQQAQRLTERIQTIARFAEPEEATGSSPAANRPETQRLFFGTDGAQLFGAVEDESSIVHLGSTEEFVDLLGRLEFAVSLVARQSPLPGQRQLDAVLGIASRLDQLLLVPLQSALLEGPIRIVADGLVAGFPWRLLPSLRARSVSLELGGSNEALSLQPTVIAIVGPDVEADQELQQLAQCFPHLQVIDGPQATVAETRKAFAEADLVHVAAHGSLDGADPLLSSLQLFDGSFTLYDIESLPRLPHTVVLAACRLAGETVRNTGYGLGSVLISGGVSQVVATAQPLADRHSGEVMGALYRQLAQHGSASRALAGLEFDDPFTDAAARSLIVMD